MVDIQARVDYGYNHSFTFIALLPGLWNSNNLVAFNALRLFSSIMTLSCFRACRSSHCCSFFYRFYCFFCLCLWSGCSLFRNLCFFKNSSFFFRNSSFFRNRCFFTSNCIRSFCNLCLLFFSWCLLSRCYKLYSSTRLAHCLFFCTCLCSSKYQNSP